jgi:hypothetical protein
MVSGRHPRPERSRTVAVLAAVLFALTACAEQLDYKEARTGLVNAPYGYQDRQIKGDEFSVSVTGPPRTSRTRVAMIAFLRAARIAKEHGRTHFVIEKSASQRTPGTRPILLPVPVAPFAIPVGETPTAEPFVVLLIRLLPAGAAAGPDAISAAEVEARAVPYLEQK